MSSQRQNTQPSRPTSSSSSSSSSTPSSPSPSTTDDPHLQPTGSNWAAPATSAAASAATRESFTIDDEDITFDGQPLSALYEMTRYRYIQCYPRRDQQQDHQQSQPQSQSQSRQQSQSRSQPQHQSQPQQPQERGRKRDR